LRSREQPITESCYGEKGMSLRSILGRVDLDPLKEDLETLLERLTVARAAKIDGIFTFEELGVGTLKADGTEQTVIEVTMLGTLEGWIDLANMQAGDSVTIRLYVRLKSGGTYRLYDSAIYTDAQSKPALHIVKLPTRYGIRVTLEQTAGVNRDYDHNFFRRVLA